MHNAKFQVLDYQKGRKKKTEADVFVSTSIISKLARNTKSLLWSILWMGSPYPFNLSQVQGVQGSWI